MQISSEKSAQCPSFLRKDNFQMHNKIERTVDGAVSHELTHMEKRMKSLNALASTATFPPQSPAEVHEELPALHRIADVLGIPLHERLPERPHGTLATEVEQHAFLGQMLAKHGLHPRSQCQESRMERVGRRAVARKEIEKIVQSVPSIWRRIQSAGERGGLAEPRVRLEIGTHSLLCLPKE